MRRQPDSSPGAHKRERRWDFSAVLLGLVILIVVLWLTAELWLPHPGPD